MTPLVRGQRSNKYAFWRANVAIKMENNLIPPCSILLPRIWKRPLIQVWIICYHGFLCEAVGLFVDNFDEAELNFLFRATSCSFLS